MGNVAVAGGAEIWSIRLELQFNSVEFISMLQLYPGVSVVVSLSVELVSLSWHSVLLAAL